MYFHIASSVITQDVEVLYCEMEINSPFQNEITYSVMVHVTDFWEGRKE